MNLKDYIPFWGKLTKEQQELLERKTLIQRAPKGTVVHNGSEDCLGFLIVVSGQLRGYTISEEGKEITLYRMFELDMCLFAASCIMSSIDFDIIIEAMEETEYLVIPAPVYQELMKTSLPVSNFTNDLMGARFSDVMWVMDQVMNKSFDARLAAFLIEEMGITNERTLNITQEETARHLGTAREVVTRMMKYFQHEGFVELGRGKVTIIDEEKLRAAAGDSIR